MVEGGRLEIVLAVLNCHVGSNPTLSAISITEKISCGELSERSMVNGWKPFVVTSHQRFKSSTLRQNVEAPKNFFGAFLFGSYYFWDSALSETDYRYAVAALVRAP